MITGSHAGNTPATIDLSDPDEPSVRHDGEASSDAAGRNVASIGDINADGLGDYAIGAFRHDAGGAGDAGVVYILFGTAALPSAPIELGSLEVDQGFRFEGAASGDLVGEAVAGIGDLNGDGIDDFAIGSATADPNGESGAGEVYVVFGAMAFPAVLGPSILDGSNGFVLQGDTRFAELGRSVAGAGDVNGDGLPDLVVGAPGLSADGGLAYVVFGDLAPFPATLDLSMLDGISGFRFGPGQPAERLGASVAGIGDFDGDGVDDLLFGAPDADGAAGTAAGAAYVLRGRTTGFPADLSPGALDPMSGVRIEGVDAGDRVGAQAASAGDVNADGRDDLLISSILHDAPGRPNAGVAYLIFGQPVPFPASIDPGALDGGDGSIFDGGFNGGRVGRAIGSAGDFDADGVGDWFVSSDLAAPDGRSGAGEVYVVFGRAGPGPASLEPDDLDGASGIRVQGAAAGQRLGYSVGGGSDFDGDGFDDLILGAPFANPDDVPGAGSAWRTPGRLSERLFADGFESPAAAG